MGADEIVPGLWLGDQKSSEDYEFLKKSGIGVIVNATKHIPCLWSASVEYYQVPVNDPGPTNDPDQEDNTVMYNHLPIVVEYIHEQLKKGKRVLVHCHAGRIRSASIVLCYLMTYWCDGDGRARLKKGIYRILEARPCAFHYGEYTGFRHAVAKYIVLVLKV